MRGVFPRCLRREVEPLSWVEVVVFYPEGALYDVAIVGWVMYPTGRHVLLCVRFDSSRSRRCEPRWFSQRVPRDDVAPAHDEDSRTPTSDPPAVVDTPFPDDDAPAYLW